MIISRLTFIHDFETFLHVFFWNFLTIIYYLYALRNQVSLKFCLFFVDILFREKFSKSIFSIPFSSATKNRPHLLKNKSLTSSKCQETIFFFFKNCQLWPSFSRLYLYFFGSWIIFPEKVLLQLYNAVGFISLYLF